MLPERSSPPSRLPLLLLPAVLLAILTTALAMAVLGVGHRREWPVLLLLLGAGYVRLSLSATGVLLGLRPRREPGRADTVPDPATRRDASAPPPRTAVLLPIYNEPPGPIARAVRIMADALSPEDRIELFLLSDTQDPTLAAAEAALFPPAAASRSGVTVRYRRRTPNTGRKAGNIAEFCRTAGREFDFAVILDADSLMSAEAIRALVHEL
ncbi:MAG: glycosyltransferase, partial [Gluconacetobacter diazotrophicus]|nr:glycosyltransferase [Gluconacetobacter diazotrophicus]